MDRKLFRRLLPIDREDSSIFVLQESLLLLPLRPPPVLDFPRKVKDSWEVSSGAFVCTPRGVEFWVAFIGMVIDDSREEAVARRL
jgi:hypothetical protein